MCRLFIKYKLVKPVHLIYMAAWLFGYVVKNVFKCKPFYDKISLMWVKQEICLSNTI